MRNPIPMPFVASVARRVTLGLGVVLVTACGARVEGTYAGNDQSFLESITLKANGKANVRFMGMTRQGEYEIDGREVTIVVGNDTQVLSFDDRGCLVAGGFLGTYCKDGDGEGAGEGPDAADAARARQLAGVYEAGDGRDSIRLDFERDGEVKVTLREGGATGDTAAGTYEVDGDRVRIAVVGGEELVLVRDGDVLEGKMGYATLRFEKR